MLRIEKNVEKVTKEKVMKDTKGIKDTKALEWRRNARVAGDSDGREYKIANKIMTNDRKSKAKLINYRATELGYH